MAYRVESLRDGSWGREHDTPIDRLSLARECALSAALTHKTQARIMRGRKLVETLDGSAL